MPMQPGMAAKPVKTVRASVSTAPMTCPKMARPTPVEKAIRPQRRSLGYWESGSRLVIRSTSSGGRG